MLWLVKKPEYFLIRAIQELKKLFRCNTYHIENVFVLLILIGVAFFTDKGWIEYIGVLAVFFSFNHASIAEYMREAEARREVEEAGIMVTCHYKLPHYFYAKEICWFAYFFLLGAHSALVGVIIFLLYQPWRRLWRKYNPI